MSQLIWVTPQSSIANLGIGVAANVQVLASNTANNGSVLRYQLIGGALPPGLTLSSNGDITGTPTYSTPGNNFFTAQTYNFVIRVSSSDGTTPIDGKFSLIVTNQVNSDFTWVTAGGDLGTVPNGVFYQLPLQVTETLANSSVTFSFISGELPPGMQVVRSGYLQGVPTLLNAIAVDTSETFKFSIRATNSAGHVRDQAFSISVTNVFGPVIEPSSITGAYYLGSVFDGSYYNEQLTVTELNPNVAITWSNIGSLPPGVSLNTTTGLLSGYIQPLELVGNFGPAGYDGTTTVDSVVENQEFDFGPYDFNQLNQTLSYSFTIQAYDGANYDLQPYVLNVVSRSGFTADNANVSIDNNYLTVDTINTYIPAILNGNVTVLPTARSGAYYAYKFDGYDFQGDTITYSLTNSVGAFDAYVSGQDAGFDYGSTDPEGINYVGGGVGYDSNTGSSSITGNLPGLALDPQTGWLYGKVNPQTAALRTFTFGVQVSKVRDNITYTSNTIFFNLPVQGDINNIIEWVTPANLGYIDNGSTSELSVKANSIKGLPLVYSLVDQSGVSVRLPQGLELLPSGEISGRVSFEVFSLDDFDTTFDGDKMTIDRTFKFTVQAATDDFTLNADGTYAIAPSATATREFTLTTAVIDQEPYDNLYLRATPAANQRAIFNSLISNQEIFKPSLIYRPDDPWFGVAKNLDMLFLPGLKPSDLNTYATAILENHYTKSYQFGSVKTAVVLDNSYNVKYEVVYVEVNDPELNSSGVGPGLELDLTNKIANPYIDINGGTHKILFPNSSQNMIDRLVTNVGYYDQSSLPEWMTSNQPGATAGTFSTPLGYTRAVVLAYTMPGASNLIAYRLNNSGLSFSNIDFTVDRYLLDDYYTSNFDTSTATFISGRETTFDALPNFNVGAITASVEYAVNTPYDQINGRSISYINNAGGIDGVTTFQNGDTMVFAQQEGFINGGPYDGWVGYQDGYIGDDIFTSVTEGYDSEGYDEYSIIPGYLEKSVGTSTVNKRGGIWRINIINEIVQLVFVQEIELNQRVRVSFGKTYGGSILYYATTNIPGQSVPEYVVFKVQTESINQKRTTFNGDSTKFFSHRDQYYTPGTQDKYIKFPQFGVFN